MGCVVAEIYIQKTLSGWLPADDESKEYHKKRKIGSLQRVNVTNVRNPLFHRKYFALLNIGFDNWTPPKIESVHGDPVKNFDSFRKDIAILCGYYHVVIRLDGTSRIVADSISFSKMDNDEFEKLYNKTIDLFIQKIYGDDMTPEKINEIVEQYMSFT